MKPTPGSVQDEHVARGRCFDRIKVATALSLLLLLMYAGFRGRQHAWLQVKLNEITLLRDQLQQQLDKSAGAPGPARSQLEALEKLKLRLGEFDAEYPAPGLTQAEDLDLRLSRATLANAEHGFTAALSSVAAAEEKPLKGTAGGADRWLRIFQVRGDAFYALHQWENALEPYRQLFRLQPARLATLGRIGECQYALGRTNEAVSTYAQLAQGHTQRGWALLRDGKADAAAGHFQQAVAVATRLPDQLGRGEMAALLASNHNYLGDALLLQGKADAASGQYRKAIEIQSRSTTAPAGAAPAGPLLLSYENLGNALLVQRQFPAAIAAYEQAIAAGARLAEQPGANDMANELAASHDNQANAWLAQGKAEPALTNYQKAIELRTGLLDQEPGDESRQELAMSYNNRGVAHRAQDHPEPALEDFDKAIEILKPLTEQPGRHEGRRGARPSSGAATPQVQLVVEFAYSERAIDVLTRARLREQTGRTEPPVALATALKNRGYTCLAQGKPAPAVSDFKQAVDIYTRLVEQEAQKDLAVQFARSLSALAWVYATYPDSSVRNGAQARTYALKACELSGWQAPAALETLAAACAETGDFADAVKWQETALRMTSAKNNTELRARLELYQSGRPCRASIPETQ